MKKLLVLAWAGAALLSGGMLRAENILLSTRNSSLLLTAEKGKTPLFQYFGARVASPDDILASGAAFGDAAYPQFGAQCYREVAIQATHGDGSMSLELAVESVSRDRRDGSETTAIAMKDKHYPFFVTLFYKTYDDCEVIETWTEISHTEKKPVTLYRFASAYMPVRRGDTWLTHFHGTWGAECYLHEEPLTDGMKVLKNKDGVRNTQRDNPSLMISLDGRPRELTRPRHRRHAGLGRQLPHRPGQRQHPHHAPLRGHQRGAVAIHAATPRGLHDPGIRLHVQRRGQERREPQHPPMGAPPPAQPRNRASRRAAQLVGGRLFQGQPGRHGPDDGRPGGPGRRTVRDGRRLVRRQIPAQQRRDEPRRLDGLPRETAAGHRGSDRVGPQTRREVRHLDRTRDDQHPERTLSRSIPTG